MGQSMFYTRAVIENKFGAEQYTVHFATVLTNYWHSFLNTKIGDKGENGDFGFQGAPGPQGQKGETGFPGAHGVVGDFGLQGEIGPDGKPGKRHWPFRINDEFFSIKFHSFRSFQHNRSNWNFWR